MTFKSSVFSLIVCVPIVVVRAQHHAVPEDYSKPPSASWPTYHGDYSGRHSSALRQVTPDNMKGLSLAWVYRANTSTQGAIMGGMPQSPATARPGGGAPRPTAIKAAPLQQDGMLYFTTVNNAYAVDARSGTERWHYAWQGRSVIGNRGMGMRGNALFFETGDNHVVSLDATTGKERWSKPLATSGATNFSTSAPLIIRNHVILGVGGDSGPTADWLESRDPETGELQWRWNVTPSKGEPGFDTWPNSSAAANGGGAPWQPPTYDPQLNLLYVTTGNPTSTYNGKGREGDNLYTCSVVALNPNTGKMVWYFQISPHDTHDWDATQVPVLIDATFEGKPRKMLALAARNGYYFLFDRATGEKLLMKPFIATVNSFAGTRPDGTLMPIKDLEPSVGGSLVSPGSDGATNYPPPTYLPSTGLLYVHTTSSWSLFYIAPDAKDPTGFNRGSEYHTGMWDSALIALDAMTGTIKWQHKYPETGGIGSGAFPGLLSTETGLVFTGNPSGDVVAYDARTGKSLWHAPLGARVTNAPETYMLDGKQYVLVAAGDGLFAFYLQ